MHKKGISLNSVEKTLSHSADKICRRALMCFERNLVSKIFIQRRGKLHSFLSHRTEKTSAENHSMFQKISGWKKYFMDKKGEGITLFLREVFVSLLYFIGEHFGVSEKFFYRKFSCIEGGITVLSKIFVSQDRNEKLCKGTLLFSGKLLVSKRNMDKTGHITIFSRNFYVLQCRNFS